MSNQRADASLSCLNSKPKAVTWDIVHVEVLLDKAMLRGSSYSLLHFDGVTIRAHVLGSAAQCPSPVSRADACIHCIMPLTCFYDGRVHFRIKDRFGFLCPFAPQRDTFARSVEHTLA